MMMPLLLLLSAVPIDTPSNWISTDDYPESALDEGAEGPVSVRLEISESGVPTDCVVTQGTGNTELDGKSCQLLIERARFEPAAKKQSYSTVIQWKIPAPPLMPTSIMGFAAISPVKNGQIQEECALVKIGDPPEEMDLCEMFESEVFTDAVDAATYKNASAIRARLLIGPIDVDVPRTGNFSDSAVSKTLLEAWFDVDSKGAPSRCEAKQDNVGPSVEELCQEMISARQEFDVSSITAFPAKMMFKVDVTAE